MLIPRGPIFAVLMFAGCASLVDRIPRRALTDTAIGETKVRIAMYLQSEGSLPAGIQALPTRQGYANRTADGWGRPLFYTIEENGFALTSLGKDGVPGGAGEDADVIRHFQIADGRPEEVQPQVSR